RGLVPVAARVGDRAAVPGPAAGRGRAAGVLAPARAGPVGLGAPLPAASGAAAELLVAAPAAAGSVAPAAGRGLGLPAAAVRVGDLSARRPWPGIVVVIRAQRKPPPENSHSQGGVLLLVPRRRGGSAVVSPGLGGGHHRGEPLRKGVELWLFKTAVPIPRSRPRAAPSRTASCTATPPRPLRSRNRRSARTGRRRRSSRRPLGSPVLAAPVVRQRLRRSTSTPVRASSPARSPGTSYPPRHPRPGRRSPGVLGVENRSHRVGPTPVAAQLAVGGADGTRPVGGFDEIEGRQLGAPFRHRRPDREQQIDVRRENAGQSRCSSRGTPGRTRTDTRTILSRLPLPIGLRGLAGFAAPPGSRDTGGGTRRVHPRFPRQGDGKCLPLPPPRSSGSEVPASQPPVRPTSKQTHPRSYSFR